MISERQREAINRLHSYKWDPVANGVKCYAAYHGITEEEARRILEAYGGIDHINEHSFMIEHWGSREEAMILRRVVEHHGGKNPPLIS